MVFDFEISTVGCTCELIDKILSNQTLFFKSRPQFGRAISSWKHIGSNASSLLYNETAERARGLGITSDNKVGESE